MDTLLLRNARLINEGQVREVDLLIEGDRIARIDTDIRVPGGASVIDVDGKYLLPGMIDDQVHFREPGLTHKGDLASESAAAVAGGITSFMDMPNVNPLTTTRAALADKYALAAGRCRGNYGFYLGATNTNIDEIRALQVGEACGIKAFMGASTGDMLMTRRRSTGCSSTLRSLLSRIAKTRRRSGRTRPLRASSTGTTCRSPNIRRFALRRPVTPRPRWRSNSQASTMRCFMCCI
jgi:dihydroorotase-like cyclic amidohydrolase